MPSFELAAPILPLRGKSTNCRHFSPRVERLDWIERLHSNRTTLETVNRMKATNRLLNPVGE